MMTKMRTTTQMFDEQLLEECLLQEVLLWKGPSLQVLVQVVLVSVKRVFQNLKTSHWNLMTYQAHLEIIWRRLIKLHVQRSLFLIRGRCFSKVNALRTIHVGRNGMTSTSPI